MGLPLSLPLSLSPSLPPPWNSISEDSFQSLPPKKTDKEVVYTSEQLSEVIRYGLRFIVQDEESSIEDEDIDTDFFNGDADALDALRITQTLAAPEEMAPVDFPNENTADDEGAMTSGLAGH